MIDAILNLLFPLACILCNTQVRERRWGPVCPSCWDRMQRLQRPFCPQCGMPAPHIEGLCGSCRLGEHAFDFARSALIFNDPLREVIHHLKYSDRVSLARPLGRLLCECLEREAFQGHVVLPVPLHRKRERRRGFNQASLIAESLARLNRTINTTILHRKKNTPSQTGLSRSQRTLNLAGAFGVCGRVPECVIVVDDVYTTGSTLHEIAKTLKRHGAERVEVLTVARVPSPEGRGWPEGPGEGDKNEKH
jgi:ComF family protein